MATLIAAAINVVADDLILTTDSKCIKAKIVEVSKTSVKYKDVTNLNGPTFVLETSDIQSIVYENGNVQNFNKTNNNSATGSTYSTQNASSSSNYTPASGAQQQYSYNANYGKIIWDEDGYYLNGKKIADGAGQLNTWMAKNAPAISRDYYQFQKRMNNTWKVGAFCMMPIGFAALITGSALASGGAGDGGIFAGGISCAVIGGAMISAGIPMIIVGVVRSKRNNLVDWYNEHSHSYSQVPMQFELQSSADGIGLAFKF